MELLNVNEVNTLLGSSQNALIGVSGGLDSMVLLTWLNQNKEHFSTKFTVMYVNHGIHQDSDKWGEVVESYCKILEVPYVSRTVSLNGLGNNVEYAARKARYKAFCELQGTDALIIAHHINDQCENFMLKLFRGSGVKGLSAMPTRTECWYDNNIILIRPMLSITRDHIEDWGKENNVPHIEDPSNQDIKYDRNYIRQKIWPVIQERFDIADINTVRSIAHLSEAWELVVELADMDIHNCLITLGLDNKPMELDWIKVKALSYPRIKNVVLRILGRRNIYNFSINHVEQFSQGLIDATIDSRNELSLRGFAIRKVGKKLNISFE